MGDGSLLARWRRAVAAHPDAPAAVDTAQTLSFAALDARAEALARRVAAPGVGPGDVVGVCLPRSVELLVAILAVLRAGAAFLPLDPAYPPQRLAHMCDDGGAVLVVADHDPPWRPAGVGLLRADRSEPASVAAGSPPDDVPPGAAAYVIHTSGSTGRPKGVRVSHRSLAALLDGLERSGAVRDGPGRVGWNASPSFDASVQQWVRVCRGDTVVVLDDAVRRDPRELARAAVAGRLTDLDITPSHAQYVVPHLRRMLNESSGLRLWVGGEALPAPLWRRLAELAAEGVCDAVNVYGTTETTVDSTAALVAGDRPHLGAALPGQTVRVLDERLRPTPPGVRGEIYIGGPAVADGYPGRPGLTAARFVADPWAAGGTRMYRTGDLAVRGADGAIEHHGRADRQVKVRGHRVELGEIEAVLGEAPDVLECAVLLRERGAGSLLDAYVSMAPGGDAAGLRARAEATLPEWMRPATYTELDALPRTPSGKLDREALRARAHFRGS